MPVIIFLVIVAVLVIMYFMYNNREIALRNEAEAQRQNITNIFDKMWKVFNQQGQVAEKYYNDFKSIYPELISGRYMNRSGEAWKFIHEDNPLYNNELYKMMQVSIEALRAEFATNQTRMLDIIRQHKTLIEQYPGKWFINNKQPIEYEVISSTKTEDVMNSRKEDDIKIFS